MAKVSEATKAVIQIELNEICKTLRTNGKNVLARIAGLKIGDTCTRCCGSGHYSYCQMHGTTCFKCSGNGMQMPTTLKGWKELHERAKEVASNGKLAEYETRLRNIAIAKKAYDEGFEIWTSHPVVAAERKIHHTKCSEQHHAMNRIFCDLLDTIKKLTDELTNGIWSKTDRKYIKPTDERKDELTLLIQQTLQHMRDVPKA